MQMIEDKRLIWRFKRGSSEALARIYEKYYDFLHTLASGLLNDAGAAEDVVHDFFVSFAQKPNRLKVRGNLKSFLAVCVVNRARDRLRKAGIKMVALPDDEICAGANCSPDAIVLDEELQRVVNALACLNYEQREVVMLRAKGGMKFREIAESLEISINTAQSRYRYGIDKLRSLVNGEVEK